MKKAYMFRKFMALIVVAFVAVVAAFALSAAVQSESYSVSADSEVIAYADDSATTEEASSEKSESNATFGKAIAAGVAIGLAALGGAIAMGIAVSKSAEGISRQPEAEGKIRGAMMFGLIFIETVVIYALIVSILIVFVL